MNIRLIAVLTGFAAVLSCSIICGFGCDFIEPGECLGPGELFGPCNADLPAKCNGDLACVETKVGSICLPGASAADDFEAATCASWRGTMACDVVKDMCFLPCDGSDDCEGGTACDEVLGMCLYPGKTSPLPDEGEYFGPCGAGVCNDGGTCIERAAAGLKGTMCLPPCGACGDPDVIDGALTIGNTAPACISNDLCAIHCGSHDDCAGNTMCMDGLCIRLD